MILEAFTVNVKEGQSAAFEQSFREASKIIATSPGYISHELHRCLEVPGRYIFLATWRTLEDHTIGFRGSPEYQQWKAMLHHYYDPFPTVEHFEQVALR